jgi:ribosome maturation factor RimP
MGLQGPFFFVDRDGKGYASMPVTTLREKLIELVEPLLVQLGYELVELEYGPSRGHAQLRIFIDKPDGVGIEDCERVSREVSSLLDVEDPIPTAFTLEVSSPGLDRVLRTPGHYRRFVGERVKVELAAPREGRKRYTGTLTSVDDAGIQLQVDNFSVGIPFEEIAKARLAP